MVRIPPNWTDTLLDAKAEELFEEEVANDEVLRSYFHGHLSEGEVIARLAKIKAWAEETARDSLDRQWSDRTED